MLAGRTRDRGVRGHDSSVLCSERRLRRGRSIVRERAVYTLHTSFACSLRPMGQFEGYRMGFPEDRSDTSASSVFIVYMLRDTSSVYVVVSWRVEEWKEKWLR